MKLNPIPYGEYILLVSLTNGNFEITDWSGGSIKRDPFSRIDKAVLTEYSVSEISRCPFAVNKYNTAM